ncbi:MAG: hypothetical protein JJ953_05080 [Gracilimonas sp.]|uniref:hypothetical protein n=1 Tax=Gracilimonas sp. TaxID=1974203 RepID=UPI001AFE2F32|nr:hypothetical protein [Gracilimonas sp.]MBO6585456.1 hypothetical protein [Gracilimonas sp.]MBO6616452.1 hypothetical protein [Gracilimonas sp.]
MKFKAKLSFLLFTGLLFVGCSSSKNLPTRTDFSFEYNQNTYHIISISAPSGEGYNYLIQYENDESVLRSMDTNQDGIIDLVQYGEISLEEANTIYTYGIQVAIEQQKFKARKEKRIFTHTENNLKYTLQTFGYYTDLLYNKFEITNLTTGDEELFFDMDADGELDTIEQSDRTVKDAQEIYQRILQIGIDRDMVVFRFDKFIVLIIPQEKAS